MDHPVPHRSDGLPDPAASSSAGDGVWQRLAAYSYLSAPERLEYVAVMRVFCSTLLADLAVPDVVAGLARDAAWQDRKSVV